MPLDNTEIKPTKYDDDDNISVGKEVFDDDDREDLFFSCSEGEDIAQPSASASVSVSVSALAPATDGDTLMKTTRTATECNTNTKTKDKPINTDNDNGTDTDIEEEDEHTLTAFGDISLSETDFVPGLASALTPEKPKNTNTNTNSNQEKKSLRLKHAERELSEIKQRSIPMVIRKVLPPGPKKSVRNAELVSFESMVFELKRARDEERSTTQASADGNAASTNKLKLKPDLDRRHSRPNLVDLKNVGTTTTEGEEDKNHPENRPGYGVDMDKMTDGVGDENSGVMRKSNKYVGLRGNAKLPKRPPLPRWEDVNDERDNKPGNKIR